MLRREENAKKRMLRREENVKKRREC